jgi:hypothetical protein
MTNIGNAKVSVNCIFHATVGTYCYANFPAVYFNPFRLSVPFSPTVFQPFRPWICDYASNDTEKKDEEYEDMKQEGEKNGEKERKKGSKG